MNSRDSRGEYWFPRAVLVLWLITSAFIVFWLREIDWIVHHDLYGFGLQFSLVWASPYWATVRAIYVCLTISLILSSGVLVLDIWKRFKNKGPMDVQGKEGSVPVSCPSCKRGFSKALVMLDLSSGEPKLVNVCPYCNAVLRSADEKSLESIQVDLDEKVVS